MSAMPDDTVHAVHAAGAHRVIVNIAASDSYRQTELIAKAATPL